MTALQSSLRFGALAIGMVVTACGSAQAPAPAPAPAATDSPPAPRRVVDAPAASSVPPPAAQEQVSPALASLLEDGFEERLPGRVKSARSAVARAHLDDEPPPPPASIGDVTELCVLEAPADPEAARPEGAVRVVVDTAALRVALWMDRSQLAKVVVSRTTLASSAQARPSANAPVALPGLRVELLEERGGRARVQAIYEYPSPDSGLLRLGGWLDRSLLGTVYEPSVFAGDAGAGEQAFIDRETELRQVPGGAILARVAKGAGGVFFPVTVLGHRGGQAEVSIRTAELEFSAFVDRSALETLVPETPRGWGRGHFETGLWQRWPKEQVRVPAGTCIYERPGGQAIGVFKREHLENVVILEGSKDYRAYRLPHEAVGYVAARDVMSAAEGAEQVTSKQSLELVPGAWTCPKR